MLLCLIMIFLPAHRWASVDAWKKPSIKKIKMPRWVVLFIIVQLWIVYTYASVAKLYPDWLNATVAENLMRGKKDYWLVGDFLQQDWVHYCIAYTGILFDLLVIPLLLFKRTRWFIVIASVFFHLFNSIYLCISNLLLLFCLGSIAAVGVTNVVGLWCVVSQGDRLGIPQQCHPATPGSIPLLLAGYSQNYK